MAGLDSIYNSLEGQIDSLVTGKYTAIASLMSGPLHTAMAINLILVGFATMRGVVTEPFGAYLTTWFKAYLVVLAATSNFGPWLGAEALRLPDLLVGALGGAPVGAQFDGFVDRIGTAAFSLADSAPKWEIKVIGKFGDPVAWTLAYLVLIAGYIVGAVAITLALFIKFGLAVTVVVGPIFVGALMFPSSSGMFFSWLGRVLGYAIESAALGIVMIMVTGVLGNIAAGASAGPEGAFSVYSALILQFAAVVISISLFLQVQGMGSFAGGGGASGGGLVSAALPSPRTSLRAARSAGQSIRGASSGLARGVGGAISRFRGV